MLSQLLLLAASRDLAALPDSSARSQAPMTFGSRPVRSASREANCCCPVVRSLLAAAEGDWARASASAKERPAAGDVPGVALTPEALLVAATEGAGTLPLNAAI